MEELKPPSANPDQPHLVPPGGDPDMPQKSNLLFILLLFFALFIVVDLVILGYWFLADHSEEPVTQPVGQHDVAGPVAEKVPGNQPLPAASPVLLEKDTGENTLILSSRLARDNWLTLQAQAESENITLWADDKYRVILAGAEKADALFQTGTYQKADAAYIEAHQQLESLLNLKEEYFSEGMDLGKQAYLQGDYQGAITGFSRALAIHSQHEEAGYWHRRAVKLETVQALVQTAREYMTSDQLLAAEEKVEEALALDSDYAPGRSLLQVVATKKKELAFKQEMSRFYTALEGAKLNDAGLALKHLEKMGGDVGLVQDARRQYQAAVESAQLRRLGTVLRDHVTAEQWEMAVKTADKILAIQPDNGFARTEKNSVEKRLSLEQRLQQTLGEPQRLVDSRALAEAEELLGYAKTFLPQGQRLAPQVTALEQLLVKAKIEVEVTLYSDNNTEVAVYRVGRFGRFSQKKLYLRPGAYTLVGSKAGFRDFRQTMVVEAGKNTEFHVTCEEPI